jgi:hypothetical protein
LKAEGFWVSEYKEVKRSSKFFIVTARYNLNLIVAFQSKEKEK